MAHGLSPGGEINMGKRLKPQAFSHNLLPSSFFLLQRPCRASSADFNLKPNPSGLWSTVKPKTQMTTVKWVEGWMLAIINKKQTRNSKRKILYHLITSLLGTSYCACCELLAEIYTTTVRLYCDSRCSFQGECVGSLMSGCGSQQRALRGSSGARGQAPYFILLLPSETQVGHKAGSPRSWWAGAVIKSG